MDFLSGKAHLQGWKETYHLTVLHTGVGSENDLGGLFGENE